MRMKRKIQNLFVAASFFVGALGFGGTAQAITIAGNSSSTTTPIGSLTYTPGAAFSLTVPVGPGPTLIPDLGTFTLNGCPFVSGDPCTETFNDIFTLKINFTLPTVLGNPALFTANIVGEVGRNGNSANVEIGSFLTIDFNNTPQTLLYTGGPGGSFGQFDVWVDDPVPTGFGPLGNASTQFSQLPLMHVSGHIGNLTQEFPPNPTIPEPSTFLLLGSGLLVLGRSVMKKRFRS